MLIGSSSHHIMILIDIIDANFSGRQKINLKNIFLFLFFVSVDISMFSLLSLSLSICLYIINEDNDEYERHDYDGVFS